MKVHDSDESDSPDLYLLTDDTGSPMAHACREVVCRRELHVTCLSQAISKRSVSVFVSEHSHRS